MSGADSIDFDTLFEGSDQFAEEVGNTWMEWDGARVTAKNRWKETTQYVYATSTRETVNGAIGGLSGNSDDEELPPEGFNHSTHIPKLTEIADNLGATYMRAVMPHEDFFIYRGLDQRSASQQVRETITSYLKSKHRANNVRQVFNRMVDDLVLYGNCFAEVDYVNEKVDGAIDDERFSTGYVGPVIRRISPYDIVFNPLATNFRNAPKIVRSIKTLGELHRDVEEADDEYYGDVLQHALDMRSQLQELNAEDFDKHVQMQFDGYGTPSQYFNSGHVEILNMYGDIYDKYSGTFYKNHVITVIDRKYVIRRKPLNTYDGKPLIFHSGWRTRPDNLWAMGPLDNLVGMQYLINHLENARADAFDQMLEPTRVESGDVEAVNVMPGRPGGKYIIPSGEGSVTNLVPDTTVLTADTFIDFKIAQMERFAGLPAEQAGFRTPGEKTLGEINMLDRHASKVFKNKIIQLEHMLEQILNAEIEVAKAADNIEDLIDVVGEDGVVDFREISRKDLKSNGKLVPVGARFYDRRQQLVQNFQLMQQAISQDELAMQHFSSVKLAKMYEELMDMDSLRVVQPFVRVGEMAELQKMQMTAQQQLESESQVDLEGEVIGPETESDTSETA